MAEYTGAQLGEALRNPAGLLLDEAVEVYISETALRTDPEAAGAFRTKVMETAAKTGLSGQSLAQEYIKQSGDKEFAKLLDVSARKINNDAVFRFAEIADQPKAPMSAKDAKLDFIAKIQSNTLTLADMRDHLSTLNVSDSKKKAFNAAVNNAEKAGIPSSTLWSEFQNPEVYTKFSGAKSWVKNIQSLEETLRTNYGEYLQLEYDVNTLPNGSEIKTPRYPKVFGVKSLSNMVQDRTGAPMRGLLPRDEFNAIFTNKLPEIREVSPDVADAMDFHRSTAVRMEHIFGSTGGIKKNQVSRFTDANGVERFAIETYTSGNKTRPPLSFPANSDMGRLIERNLAAGTSDLLFDVTPEQYNEAFKKYISPELERYGDVLPVKDGKVVTTGSVVRSIVPRYMQQELGFSKDVTRALMGHTESSILEKHYSGDLPGLGDTLGDIVNDYTVGEAVKAPASMKGMFSTDADDAPGTFKFDYTDEEIAQLKEEKLAKARLAKADVEAKALELEKTRAEFMASPAGQEFLEKKRAAAIQEQDLALELEERKAAKKAERAAERKAEKQAEAEANRPKLDDEGKSAFKSGLGKLLKMGGGSLPIIGSVAVGVGVYDEARAEGAGPIAATAAGVGAGAADMIFGTAAMVADSPKIGQGSDVVPQTQSEFAGVGPFTGERIYREKGAPMREATELRPEVLPELRPKETRTLDDEYADLFGR